MMDYGQTLPTKESGKECIAERKADLGKITDIMAGITHELNTKPLIVLACRTIKGDRLLLTFDLGDHRYCPIAVLEPTERLKAGIAEVYLSQAYELVHQKEVPSFKEYDAELT